MITSLFSCSFLVLVSKNFFLIILLFFNLNPQKKSIVSYQNYNIINKKSLNNLQFYLEDRGVGGEGRSYPLATSVSIILMNSSVFRISPCCIKIYGILFLIIATSNAKTNKIKKKKIIIRTLLLYDYY